MQLLFEQLGEDIPRLQEACHHQEIETLCKIAHKHKSSTASMSMIILSDLFCSLEETQFNGSHGVEDLVQQITQEAAQVKAVVVQQLNITLP